MPLLILLILVLAGCSSGQGAEEPATPTPIQSASATADPTDTAQPSATPTDTPAPTSTDTPTPVPPTSTPRPETITNMGHTMALVPAGLFSMGSDPAEALAICQELFEPFTGSECSPAAANVEGPVHDVFLDDFYIDIYEVSNSQYANCVDEGACNPPSDLNSYSHPSYYGNSDFDNYPVISVSWYDAEAFCSWRDARLPTEAEWEKAARGTAGLTYPWGNDFDGALTNFCDTNCTMFWSNPNFNDGFADIAPVGSYPAGISSYGLFDMAGNVAEWVADWYDDEYYSNLEAGAQNPFGPAAGGRKVLRGGAFDSLGNLVRTAARGRTVPENFTYSLGFRCALSP